LAEGAERREDEPRVLTARNLRRVAIRIALVALPLAAMEPTLALVALVVVPLALIELWAVPRVASRGRVFALVVAFASSIVALLAGCALLAQVVYVEAALEGALGERRPRRAR
jgi:hypothetical protein